MLSVEILVGVTGFEYCWITTKNNDYPIIKNRTYLLLFGCYILLSGTYSNISATLQLSILHKSSIFAVLMPLLLRRRSIVALLIPYFTINVYVDSPFSFRVFQNGA